MSDSESDSEWDYILAGIAVFPAGAEEYNLSISLKSTTGSVNDNISFSSPAESIALQKTVRSMIASTVLKERTIKTYFSSVPPAFPPDKHYDIFKALKSSGLIVRYTEYPLVPLNHAEAFADLLPKGKTTSLLALDFCAPPHLHVASLSSTEADGNRVNTITQELIVSLAHINSFQGVLEKVHSSLDLNGTKDIQIPEQIMLIKPLIKSEDPGAVDIGAVVAELYPNIPVSIVTSTDIAQAAASFAHSYTDYLWDHRARTTARQGISLPVSVATTSGAAVPMSPSRGILLPCKYSVIFTNSVDNQKSVTVRLMRGNHGQTKNNLQRAVVVLDGLTLLPKGEARIKVSIRGRIDDWRDAIRVAIEQKDGPKQKFLFPRFSSNLPEDHTRYRIPLKTENDNTMDWSDHVVMGMLPE